MTKPRSQYLNQFAQSAFELERIRLHQPAEFSEDAALRAEASAEVTHAYAIQAMSRSNGSIRSQLSGLAMQALQKAELTTTDSLTLIT
jgi:hypothetical protein